MTDVRDLIISPSVHITFTLKIRNDFVSSARSALRKDGSDQLKKHFPRPYQKYVLSTADSQRNENGTVFKMFFPQS